jgi:alpha-tubulin suppressor-like RCC1 family protein
MITPELWTWGLNDQGQLGINVAGATTNRTTPVTTFSGGANWKQVANGNNYTAAIKTDGTLWSWGNGTNGKLGLGNSLYKSSPNHVGALTTWSKVSAGGDCTIAVKTDGTIWSWGVNTYGQLGLGNTTAYNSPKQIGALTTWANISSGGFSFSMAAKTDGTLWTWGINGNGQLGLGTSGPANYKSSPNQVGALTNWLVISAGYKSSLALAY